MSRKQVWIVDPPSPFAPREAWQKHLDALLETRRERRSKDLDEAIAEARATLASYGQEGPPTERQKRFRDGLLEDAAKGLMSKPVVDP